MSMGSLDFFRFLFLWFFLSKDNINFYEGNHTFISFLHLLVQGVRVYLLRIFLLGPNQYFEIFVDRLNYFFVNFLLP